jgi:hypothetical protein
VVGADIQKKDLKHPNGSRNSIINKKIQQFHTSSNFYPGSFNKPTLHKQKYESTDIKEESSNYSGGSDCG